MSNHTTGNFEHRQRSLLDSLEAFSKDHRAAHWSGTFAEFLRDVVAQNADAVARSSHEYIWDMIRSEGADDEDGRFRCKLFEELSGLATQLGALRPSVR